MRFLATALILVFCLYATGRVFLNCEARGQAPAACQLMGGHWGIWSGWDCY